MTLRIGTRGSKLALAQATSIASALEALDASVRSEIAIIKTKGDQIQDVPLSQVTGQGFFVKELENALAHGRVDVAVHSCKDMPTVLAEGLMLGAVPPRAEPRDALVSRTGVSFDELPAGARVATSSLRRKAMISFHRPELQVCELRGNVDTRLRKLDEEQFDAMVIARAALERLHLTDRLTETLPMERFLPAVAQGALAVEIRSADASLRDLVSLLDHEATHAAVRAERALLAELRGGCQLPLGAHAVVNVERNSLDLRAVVLAPDGSRTVDVELSGLASDAASLGRRGAEMLLDRGAEAILSQLSRTAPES